MTNLRELAVAAINYAHGFAHPDNGKAEMAAFKAAASPDAVIGLLDRIDRMEAQCAELERDAGRYRHLRTFVVDSYIASGAYEELDAEIDAAMAASVPKGE